MTCFWKRRTFCLITGASKGFGEGLALEFASRLAPQSVMVLTARDEDNLNSVKLKVTGLRMDIKVFSLATDLCVADADVFTNYIQDLLKQDNDLAASDFTQCLLIHNAGDVGRLSLKLSQQNDKKHLNDYWALNLTSVILISSAFFNIFSKTTSIHRYIIQISSLMALKPFKSFGTYCAAKSARDMIFNVMSKEEPDIRILSYAPGPLQTDMFKQILNETYDEDILAVFKESAQSVLTCEQSAKKLVMLMQKDCFESGSHVDYYDVSELGDITNQ